MFIAIMKHDATAEGEYFADIDVDVVAKKLHQFFLDYGFEVANGKPWDGGNSSGPEGKKNPKDSGYQAFDNVEFHICADGTRCVVGFMHCGGDGPVAYMRES